MSADFKPLVPSATRAPGGAPGRLVTAADTAGRFVPLVQGKAPAASAGPSRPASPAGHGVTAKIPASAVDEAHAAGVKPVVSAVIRDGDRITHVEVRCACGEVITIECGY